MILVKVMQYKTLRSPSREGTCGSLAINIPYLTGNQILISGILASFILLGLGIFLWSKRNKPLIGKSLNLRSAMIIMVIFLGAGTSAAYFGNWMPGILILVTCILLLVARINSLIGHENINRL